MYIYGHKKACYTHFFKTFEFLHKFRPTLSKKFFFGFFYKIGDQN